MKKSVIEIDEIQNMSHQSIEKAAERFFGWIVCEESTR
jgi:hypothetical protein